MLYELDPQGYFYGDIPFDNTEGVANWTALPPPQPMYNAHVVGAKNEETGEWTGEWVEDGPDPAPPSLIVPIEYANPTVAEWDALCIAAGAPALCKTTNVVMPQ